MTFENTMYIAILEILNTLYSRLILLIFIGIFKCRNKLLPIKYN